MADARRQRRLLWCEVALLFASVTVARLMMSYRALELGADGRQLGLLAASFAVASLFLAFVSGRLVDRMGPRRPLLLASFLVLVGSALSLWAGSVTLLILVSLVLGVGFILALVAQQSYVARLPGVGYDKAFANYAAATSTGQLLGPPLAAMVAQRVGGVVSLSTSQVGLTVACLLCLGAFAVVALLPEPVRRQPEGSLDEVASAPVSSYQLVRSIAKRPGMPLALIVSGVVGAAVDMLSAFLPAWAEERDVSIVVVGWMLAVRAIVSLASRLGMERIVAGWGRSRVLVVSLVCGTAGFAALPFVETAGGFAVMVLLGVALGWPQPLTMAWTTSAVAPAHQGAMIGIRMTANRVAQTAVPLATGLTVAGQGSIGVFWCLGALMGWSAYRAVRSPVA